MVRSLHATRLTVYGVIDPTNRRTPSGRAKETPFIPNNKQAAHYTNYLQLCYLGRS